MWEHTGSRRCNEEHRSTQARDTQWRTREHMGSRYTMENTGAHRLKETQWRMQEHMGSRYTMENTGAHRLKEMQWRMWGAHGLEIRNREHRSARAQGDANEKEY